jgi:inosine-uridine nucleoside N-ribohydrolase
MGLPGKPVDDGQTLQYLLGRDDIEVVGITTSFGNGTIDEVHPATEQLLRDLGRTDIPLFKGAGERGQPPTDAARFLAETAAKYPGEMTLLAIGPVGNLRGAAELDPSFYAQIKQIAVMGGYLEPLPMAGWEDVPERNLAGDPEGSYGLLHAACPVMLINAHICLQAPFGLSQLAPIEETDPKAHGILRAYLLACETPHMAPQDYLWDLLPAVYISYPDLFDENWVGIRSTVADLETGTLVVGSKEEGAPVNMPTAIRDVDRFYDILYEAWAKAPLR